ncbi:hypothetical protein BKA80DRAFT_4166 [Phyllosticta citrichinensis]
MLARRSRSARRYQSICNPLAAFFPSVSNFTVSLLGLWLHLEPARAQVWPRLGPAGSMYGFTVRTSLDAPSQHVRRDGVTVCSETGAPSSLAVGLGHHAGGRIQTLPEDSSYDSTDVPRCRGAMDDDKLGDSPPGEENGNRNAKKRSEANERCRWRRRLGRIVRRYVADWRLLTKPLRYIGSQAMPTEAIFANLGNRSLEHERERRQLCDRRVCAVHLHHEWVDWNNGGRRAEEDLADPTLLQFVCQDASI